MKNAMFVVACTLGVVACGESRPAETPASETTTTTTVATTDTSSLPANGTTAKAKPVTGTRATPSVNTPSSNTPSSNTPSTSPAVADRTTPVAPADNTLTGAAPVAQNPGAGDGTKDATNTKLNERDRNGAALTPMDQGGGKDRDITAAIRRSVVADGSLSFNAKNVKIITVGGKVTLRGPVKSDAEKATIESKAKAATGVTEVDNQLEVKK